MRKRIGESEHKSRIRTFVPAAVWALLGASHPCITRDALREKLLTKGVSHTMATRAINQLIELKLVKEKDDALYITALGDELKYSIRGVV